jgi:hypothetical protein
VDRTLRINAANLAAFGYQLSRGVRLSATWRGKAVIRLLDKMWSIRSGPPKASDRSPVVSVSGALRCGTNFLKYMLERDYHVIVDINSFGWKHAGVPVLSADCGLTYPSVPLAYVVKNPYAFVVSMHRYNQRKFLEGHRISLEAHEEFGRFLTGPLVIYNSQLLGSPQLRFANPVQYWNFVYWNLETLDRARFRVVGFNYEDLIVDPAGLRRIEDVAPLRRRASEVSAPPSNRLKRGSTNSSVNVEKQRFDITYYTEERYLLSYTSEQLAFVRSEVDHWLMEKRNYRIR